MGLPVLLIHPDVRTIGRKGPANLKCQVGAWHLHPILSLKSGLSTTYGFTGSVDQIEALVALGSGAARIRDELGALLGLAAANVERLGVVEIGNGGVAETLLKALGDHLKSVAIARTVGHECPQLRGEAFDQLGQIDQTPVLGGGERQGAIAVGHDGVPTRLGLGDVPLLVVVAVVSPRDQLGALAHTTLCIQDETSKTSLVGSGEASLDDIGSLGHFLASLGKGGSIVGCGCQRALVVLGNSRDLGSILGLHRSILLRICYLICRLIRFLVLQGIDGIASHRNGLVLIRRIDQSLVLADRLGLGRDVVVVRNRCKLFDLLFGQPFFGEGGTGQHDNSHTERTDGNSRQNAPLPPFET